MMWGTNQKGMDGHGPISRMNPYVAIDSMDSNFNDHFVVRRKPSPALITGAAVISSSQRHHDAHESEFAQVGDHQLQQKVHKAVVPYDHIQVRKDETHFTTFGKRPKTPGFSPVLDVKRLHSDEQYNTSPAFNVFRSHVNPVPGRAQSVSETNSVSRSSSDHMFHRNRTTADFLGDQSNRQLGRSRSPEKYQCQGFQVLQDECFNSKTVDIHNMERFSSQGIVKNSTNDRNRNKMQMNKFKPNVYKNSKSAYYPAVVIPTLDTAAVSTCSSAPLMYRNPAKGDATVAGIQVYDGFGISCTSGTTRAKTVDPSSMVPRPRPRPTGTSSGQLIPRPRTGTFYSTLRDHSNNNRHLNFKLPRQDIISPLSIYHTAIRPYLVVESGPSSTDPHQLGYIYRITSNPWSHPVFTTCSQKSPIPMSLVFDNLINIKKVGEGVYGEVYKAYFSGVTEQRVYKVVPIQGAKSVNGEKQKKFSEIEPEIIVSQELNKLRQGLIGCFTDGHASLLHTRITQGKYPAVLVDQWKTWHRSYVSQNDLPEFDLDQLFAVFELEFHGMDIESFEFRNAKQSLAVLLNVVYALGAAEAALEFEHRDLHWGNILVVKTKEQFSTHIIQGTTFRVPNCGLKSTIIDYTISRLTSTSGQSIFTDLADDEDQFCGSEDYQFEIYRMMRKDNGNDWSRFCPKSNIFWCHYLVGKLIEKGRYSDTSSATHLRCKNRMYRFQSNILKYSSCMECARRFLHTFCRDLETESN